MNGERPLPPPRPGVRHVRVPWRGVVIADDDLRSRVDRYFHWPMIILSLLVLPLLAVDYLARPQPRTALWWICVVAAALIWLAFLVEFVIKIAIAERRFEYARRNWIDVVIIVVPVLRPFRAARLVRTTKVFTLRGVGMKFARYVVTAAIGLEATERLMGRFGFKRDDGRPDPASMTRYQLMDEVRRLRRLADGWERWYLEHHEYVRNHGTDAHRQAMSLPRPEG